MASNSTSHPYMFGTPTTNAPQFHIEPQDLSLETFLAQSRLSSLLTLAKSTTGMQDLIPPSRPGCSLDVLFLPQREVDEDFRQGHENHDDTGRETNSSYTNFTTSLKEQPKHSTRPSQNEPNQGPQTNSQSHISSTAGVQVPSGTRQRMQNSRGPRAGTFAKLCPQPRHIIQAFSSCDNDSDTCEGDSTDTEAPSLIPRHKRRLHADGPGVENSQTRISTSSSKVYSTYPGLRDDVMVDEERTNSAAANKRRRIEDTATRAWSPWGTAPLQHLEQEGPQFHTVEQPDLYNAV